VVRVSDSLAGFAGVASGSQALIVPFALAVVLGFVWLSLTMLTLAKRHQLRLGRRYGVRSAAMGQWFAFAVLVVLSSLALPAQERAATLWVTLGDSDQLVEIDAYTFKEIRRITTDPRPHGLATSPDGSKVYIGSDRTGNFQVIDAAPARSKRRSRSAKIRIR
jgi:hypothetical protein